jgi:hypothetical protein
MFDQPDEHMHQQEAGLDRWEEVSTSKRKERET